MKPRAIVCAVVLAVIPACASAPHTVQLSNGATGHVISDCLTNDECHQRSKKRCSGTNYGVHEIHEIRREVTRGGAGVPQVMGMSPTELATSWRYVVECNPSTLIVTQVVIDDALARAEQELNESKAQVVAVNNAIVRRRNIAVVCSLRPGSLRDEEIEIARKQFGDFTCP